MNLEMVESALYEVTAMFFKEATVAWAEQNMTVPKPPYVTLKTGNVSKTTFPVTDEDGNRYYPCSTVMEINLYTKGRPVKVGNNVTGNFANTSVSDMLDFFKFIESDYITDYLAGKGVSIMLNPPVRDLAQLQNDRTYRYRSMAEATVSWSESANGPYGIGGMDTVPNYSGGGTKDMAEAETDTFVETEIMETT